MVKTLIFWAYLVASMTLATGDCNTDIVARVRRRSTDIYDYQATSSAPDCQYSCSGSEGHSETFLVIEQQCTNNSNFFNECLFAITPSGEPHELRLTIYAVVKGNSTTILIQTITGGKESPTVANATIITKSTNESLNNSVCDISSLEVYRGREQAVEINHTGFILGNSGTFEIHTDLLENNLTEYMGELYRMNLSCNSSDRILPTHGCLFFKVYGDTTITDAKFNHKVPGTTNLTTDSETLVVTDKSTTETTTVTTQSGPIHDQTTFVTNLSTAVIIPPSTEFIEFDRLSITSIVLVIVGGVTILISTVMVCAVVLFRKFNGRKSSNKAAQQQNEDSKTEAIKSQSIHNCQRNPAYSHFGPTDSSSADLLSGNYSENPAYNIDAQPSAPQEPTYEVIPSDTDRTPQNVVNCSQNPEMKSEMKSRPLANDCQRNPAYGHFGHTESSPVDLLSDSCSENPAYNIDAKPSAPQEPTYEVIPSDTDRTPQNVNCSQNPAYIHLGAQVEESFRAAADATSPGDYSQNPAYGIHSNP